MTTALQPLLSTTQFENYTLAREENHEAHKRIVMTTLQDVEEAAVNGSEEEPPTREDAAEEQPQETPDRRHVDALLHISEEELSKELEPFEYHPSSGWEEAVRGWDRVGPLSCILSTPISSVKPKEAANAAPSSADPMIPNAHSSACIVEHHCESHVLPRKSFMKSMLFDQHKGSWSNSYVAAMQEDAYEWPVLDSVQKTMGDLSLGEKIEEGGMLRETPLQNRPTKLQKHNQKPNNTLVPIKNFMFLPPIGSPHLHPQGSSGRPCSCIRAPEDPIQENCFKSRTRGTRMDPVVKPERSPYSAVLTSKRWKCGHEPHMLSALTISISNRHQVPTSSRHDAAHRSSWGMNPNTAAGAPACMHASKTVRALPSCARAVK